jgi:hypothetical protein
MIETMYIGSGDTSSLLAGKDTRAHALLMQRFVSGQRPYYNAKASPIDALRTGVILEDRFSLTLDDSWFSQYSVTSPMMDVFKAHLDFGKMEHGKLTDFIELKTMFFTDFLELISVRDDEAELLKTIQKQHRQYNEQVQQQLFCSGLESCQLVFVPVYSYVDEENMMRDIKASECITVRIYRNEKVIERIVERGRIFQQIKDYYE